jgi:serine/threonine-protein kinase RIO1
MMHALLCDPSLREVRRGLRKMYLRETLSEEAVLETLQEPGEVLKESAKGQVRVVNGYVVKESRSGGVGAIKRSLHRNRYRQAWVAAHFLRQHGVDVPEPIAFVERRLMGVVFSNCMVSRHLSTHRNVEQFLAGLIQRGASPQTIEIYLNNLAIAVNKLTATGAYHADLSGKNILTRDGQYFYFIDLDAVQLDVTYTEELRLKNHVQLYDSFCDALTDQVLVPFLEQMLPAEIDLRVWMPRVRKEQKERRKRTARKQGL